MSNMREPSLAPSLRASGGLGAFLVRAVRERRPEGPSYLLPTIFLAGGFLQHTFPPIGIWGFPQDPSEGSSLFPNYLGKLESADFADVTERSQDLRVHNSFFVRREPHLRRPGQKLLSFWVWLVVRSRDRATPPTW